ncbi:hypothetical protein Efla_002807 [Eimeria flavescens]
MSSPAAFVPRAAVLASCFLRPPGRFKRASLREAPRRVLGGPWESLVKAAQKAFRCRSSSSSSSSSGSVRVCCRRIPVPSPVSEKSLAAVRGVPSVSAEALQRRLCFLLGPAATQQQQQAKLREGLTPYQAELFMWERQVRSSSSSNSSNSSSSNSSGCSCSNSVSLSALAAQRQLQQQCFTKRASSNSSSSSSSSSNGSKSLSSKPARQQQQQQQQQM